MHFVDDFRGGVGEITHAGGVAGCGGPCPCSCVGLGCISVSESAMNVGDEITVPSTKIYCVVAPASRTPSMQA